MTGFCWRNLFTLQALGGGTFRWFSIALEQSELHIPGGDCGPKWSPLL